jgi:hypothetical protein
LLAVDRTFLQKYRLTGEAAIAQRYRNRTMILMRKYGAMVEAIKRCDVTGLVKLAGRHPRALPRFREPLAKRLKRLSVGR